MRAHELPRHGNVFFALEPENYNWQITADALRPQSGLRQLIERQHVGPRP